MQGEEEFPRLGLFEFDIMKFSASELLLLSEESSSGKPQPARPLVILLLLSVLSEADERLRLLEPPCARPPHGDVHRFRPTGWCAPCSLHAALCTHSSVAHAPSHLLVQELLERWVLHRIGHRSTFTFQINPSLAESATCHVPQYHLFASLHPGLWPQGAVDSPQSQAVSLAFVSAPAASLSASFALATCYILGRSSDVLSLTPQAGPGLLCAHPAPRWYLKHSYASGCLLPPHPGLCPLQVTSNGSIGRDLPSETQPQNPPPQPAPNAWQVIKGVLFR